VDVLAQMRTLLGSWLAGLRTPLLLLQTGVLTLAALFILTRPDVPLVRE
jgi:hypothetical protein